MSFFTAFSMESARTTNFCLGMASQVMWNSVTCLASAIMKGIAYDSIGCAEKINTQRCGKMVTWHSAFSSRSLWPVPPEQSP